MFIIVALCVRWLSVISVDGGVNIVVGFGCVGVVGGAGADVLLLYVY